LNHLGHRASASVLPPARCSGPQPYASPVYVTGLTCCLVTRYDRFGNARIPGLQLLLIRWIGARNVHPRADLEDPPGMSSFGRVTLFRI